MSSLPDNNITTVSGKKIYLHYPDADLTQINIEDIAHATSHQCRFGGHMHEFYSVAQHMLMCSMMAPDGFKLEALLHDASEGYIVDMPTPIKKMLSEYYEVEARIQEAIGLAFNVNLHPLSPEVQEVDRRMLITEMRQLKLTTNMWQVPDVQPYPVLLIPMTSEQARDQFLRMFYQLTEGELKHVA